MSSAPNLDPQTVDSFGDEWQRFDQQAMATAEAERVFEDYFCLFPWDQLPPDAEGFDMGCGSGRWARFAALAEAAGLSVASLPLSYYRRCSLYKMSTDARDRFGTPLEQRFTRSQIRDMCAAAGLVDVRFSSRAPYWCVVGFKAR